MKPGNREKGIIYISTGKRINSPQGELGQHMDREGKPGCRGESPGKVGIQDLRVLSLELEEPIRDWSGV
jgi:hypothetical protein